MHTDPITRHHVDVHGRNVHYRRRGNGPPVLLLHASPRSSAALVPLMEAAPEGVTVLAFDTPGCGDSAPLALVDANTEADAGHFAQAFAETLDVLGIRRAAVYGTHTGAAIAMAFAVRHPDRVAKLVLDGLSLFDADERGRLLGDYLPPIAPVADGSHLTRLWSRVRDQQLFFPWNEIATRTRLWRPLPDAARLHTLTLDLLRAGDAYRGPYRAAISYQPGDDLAQLRVPALIGARPHDVLHSHLARLPAPPANVRIETLPGETGAWAERVWTELRSASGTPAPPPGDALPATHLGSALVGPAGSRVHLRGALGGAGRPRVLLHDSPGSARLLDKRSAGALGERPVLAPDLPGHGDSDPATDLDETAERIDAALRAGGIGAADVEGVGAGSVVAARLAQRAPGRYSAPPITPAGPDAFIARATPPRPDGGHLLAAWLHARDEAILGPAWTADARRRHDFGTGIDIDAVHRHCVATLVEAPSAEALRRALLAEARRTRD